ncbi:MAG: DUF87 domain-containing protein [Chloroflexi bacterium]|nr:DUF87 domain-containing protein [Chloroflexota bacterium]
MQIADRVLTEDPLVKLIQRNNFVGWVFDLDYDTALVMTNDLWKSRSGGVPHNCFLVACSFDPDQFSAASFEDKEVVLLRVVGSANLPQDDDIIRTKIDGYQSQTGTFGASAIRPYDDITQNQMQFDGLKCRVLGTFYTDTEGTLRLGSDLETFTNAVRLNVYRPRAAALKIIVNHVDPMRQKAAEDEAQRLGIVKELQPFPIGTVRYTSTDRLHRRDETDRVQVHIQPSDFLARRTAVLGMTRTGKSNMVKQTVSVVKRVADQSGVRIGQLIYDLNGEYANANQDDKGAISEVYTEEVVRYRMVETEGFEQLQNNFYLQVAEGFATIRRLLGDKIEGAGDVSTFLGMSLDEPDPEERGAHCRWQVRVAAYQALLRQAEFAPPEHFRVRFPANADVRAAVSAAVRTADTGPAADLPDPSRGLSLEQARDWFLAARKANKGSPLRSKGAQGDWLDAATKAILNMIANKNDNDAYINGWKVLQPAREYHSPRRQQEVGDEIYRHLVDGRIVILDLSVGEPELKERLSEQIARGVFERNMLAYTKGNVPPHIVVYIEEAHNLIGEKAELSTTWPRLAKEGAKYRIALVYATQEVSSVHPNILANTENWFVTHLNNEREVQVLSRFYDFSDFSRSLIRAQDVGFARVKTLSAPFVIPVQIDKFEPEAERARAEVARASRAHKK